MTTQKNNRLYTAVVVKKNGYSDYIMILKKGNNYYIHDGRIGYNIPLRKMKKTKTMQGFLGDVAIHVCDIFRTKSHDFDIYIPHFFTCCGMVK